MGSGARPRGARREGFAAEARAAPVFAAAALAAGIGVTVLVDDVLVLDPVLACVGIAVVAALYGVRCRRGEIAVAFGGGVAVGAAGYIGLALARVPHVGALAPTALWDMGSGTPLGMLDKWWPVVLITAIPFGLMVAVGIVLPSALLAARREERSPSASDPHANDAWREFLERQLHANR